MNDYKGKKKHSFAKSKASEKKGFKRDDEKESKQFSKLKESPNDPSWYYYSDQSLKDAGRFSFNNALGVSLPFGASELNVPGIMNIYTTPTVGISRNPSSAVNLAAKNIYSFVRHANSGHSNYDSPDLFMYFMAMDSLYSMYSWMTRIYGTARIYIQQNRYYGANVLRAMSLNPDDVARNLANFRLFINQFAVKLSAFYVPANMALFKRHVWMYGNAFADEDDPKASIYMYQPAFLFKYMETDGSLMPVPITVAINATSGIGIKTPGTMTINDVQLLADELITQVVASESMNIMSGDVLKAYGAENCWKFESIPDDYAILPLFSDEVLVQIHNSRFTGSYPVINESATTYTLDALKVTQDRTPGAGAILYTPAFRNLAGSDYPQIFDTWHKEVSPEEVMVGSRNMFAGQVVVTKRGENSYDTTGLIGTCGSELCLFATIYELDSAGNLNMTTHYETNFHYGNILSAMASIAKESRFNEAPLSTRWVTFDTASGTRTPYPSRITGELSNYTLMDVTDIMKLHDTALLSMFAVPFLGNAKKA